MGVTEYELESLEKLQTEKGVLGEDARDFGQRQFRDYLGKLINDKKGQLRTNNFGCAYLITLNNNGGLPAEDVFVRIQNVELFVDSKASNAYDPQQLSPANNETILLGQVKQGVTKTVLAFSSDYNCASDANDLAAGHRLGTAKLRYAKIPYVLPNWIVEYPMFSYFYIWLSASILLLILFAVATELLKKLQSSKINPNVQISEIKVSTSSTDPNPPT